MDVPIDNAVSWLLAFSLVASRLTGLFLLAPVFSSRQIPVRLKVMALITLAATLTPIVSQDMLGQVPTDGWMLMELMFKELLIGFAIGFAVSLVFAAIQMGAMLIDMSMGFALANVIDPMNNTQSTVLGSFYTVVATLAFLAVGGHVALLQGFVASFELVDMLSFPDFQNLVAGILAMLGQLFSLAFQIAAPVLVTLVMADVVLGIVARVVPQMNVFFVGIPVKIGIGFAAIIITLPMFTNLVGASVENALRETLLIIEQDEAPNADVA